ncbi:spore germination protein [Clostridium sp. CX1]|uniref:GerAB/ArcD/ProY family transporter n=1 Tax=Clostridium sp. CX1 TaxID=2978346 RepID=UPI0021C02846|nr:spore germination protein [Clostridium sp. CX1]MCT8976559.1 spore germination protein [Clostridium sp. CX1]
MTKYKISLRQLFAMMVLFQQGSAVVVGLGMKAKQDAWIAILLGMIGGLTLFILYFYIYFKNCNLPFTSIIKKLLGRYLGGFVAVVYILYFGYISARVLRDFTELVITSILEGTPLSAVSFIIIIVVGYSCYLGIEVLARTTEILFIVIFLLTLLLVVLVISGANPEIKNLLPILENGLKPIFATAFPLTITFPFGETIVFTMFFYNLNKPKAGIKYGAYSIIFSGLLLSFITAVNISVLGPRRAGMSNFPLLETLEKVEIGEFVTRLDSIVVLILIINGFVKIAVFAYAVVIGLQDIFRFKNYRIIIIPVCAAILISSLKMASNYSEHIQIGLELVPKYIHIPLQIVTPLLLGIITFVKSKKER